MLNAAPGWMFWARSIPATLRFSVAVPLTLNVPPGAQRGVVVDDQGAAVELRSAGVGICAVERRTALPVEQAAGATALPLAEFQGQRVVATGPAIDRPGGGEGEVQPHHVEHIQRQAAAAIHGGNGHRGDGVGAHRHAATDGSRVREGAASLSLCRATRPLITPLASLVARLGAALQRHQRCFARQQGTCRGRASN